MHAAPGQAPQATSAAVLHLQHGKQPSSLHSGASSSTNNNSKIAAGPLSGNEASQKNNAPNAAGPGTQQLYNENGLVAGAAPSDTDDEDDDEERLDCVHDILHADGDEVADLHDDDDDDDNRVDNASGMVVMDGLVNGGIDLCNQAGINGHPHLMYDDVAEHGHHLNAAQHHSQLIHRQAPQFQQHNVILEDDSERPLVHDSSMEGDIEDTGEGSGLDTDRRRKGPKRPSLFNKLQGVEQQSSVDSDGRPQSHSNKFIKKSKAQQQLPQHHSQQPQQFPLNQMRRRQSGSMGQGLNQIQISVSGERPANLTGSFQESEKSQQLAQGGRVVHAQGGAGSGGKGLFSGQHKIKLNSSTLNQHPGVGGPHGHHGNAAGFNRLNSEQQNQMSG